MPSWFFTDKPYQHIAPCPFTSNLHQVVNAVADVHNKVANNIVTLKHQGSPIPLSPLAVVINNLDVEKIDTTGAAELRQEKDRREAMSRDANDDVFTLLPPLTKSKLETMGLFTQSIRPGADDSIYSITGVYVTIDSDFRRQVRQYLLIDEATTTLMNQELSDMLAKTFKIHQHYSEA